MNTRHHDPAKREAAIADYYASGDTAKVVAERHGIPRATFSAWVGREKDDLAYVGGYYKDRGVMRPLFPERRSA